MGHQKNKGTARDVGRPLNRRRGYMPEPNDVNPKCSDHLYHVGCFHELKNHNKPRGHKSSFNFTHTSFIMAIRNYVEKIQNTKPKKKRNHSSKDNAEKIIYSLKNDIQMISKYKENAAFNSGKQPASDPFFVLSAMMCKINKLENIFVSQHDYREQLARRKDMIIMARCIKKSVLDQAQCDQQLFQEKQRKMLCLVKSLDMFEQNIRCAIKDIKKLCCPKSLEIQLGSGSCGCIEEEICAKQSKTKSRSSSPVRFDDPCISGTFDDPCKEQSLDSSKKYDIKGNVIIRF